MSVRSSRLLGPLAALLAGLVLTVLSAAGAGAAEGGTAYSLELTGEISPATASWVDSALDDAADQHAKLAIIRLDTPGGLDTSLRDIVKDILAAPMPVVVYVEPNGARAASAGVYITQAADVAAMAPQTNIGSATPIEIGPGSTDAVLDRKIRNDAAAYMRALAGSHGRNPDLGERMVRDAVNVTAQEAKAAGFIDVIAGSEEELLRRIDGFRVRGPKAQVLHTAGLQISSHDMPLRYQLLQIIVDPTIAFLLITVGLIGIAIEIFSPGLIGPGALGAISLLLGLYGTAQLPVTLAGVALLVLAFVLFVAEAHLATHGILGVAGVIALVFSGLLLYDRGQGAHVSAPVIIVAGLLLGGLLALVADRAMRARRTPVRSGFEELVGREAEVRGPLDPVGQVFVDGALWRARATDENGRLRTGDRVRVEAVEGLTLIVAPRGAGPVSSEEGAD